MSTLNSAIMGGLGQGAASAQAGFGMAQALQAMARQRQLDALHTQEVQQNLRFQADQHPLAMQHAAMVNQQLQAQQASRVAEQGVNTGEYAQLNLPPPPGSEGTEDWLSRTQQFGQADPAFQEQQLKRARAKRLIDQMNEAGFSDPAEQRHNLMLKGLLAPEAAGLPPYIGTAMAHASMLAGSGLTPEIISGVQQGDPASIAMYTQAMRRAPGAALLPQRPKPGTSPEAAQARWETLAEQFGGEDSMQQQMDPAHFAFIKDKVLHGEPVPSRAWEKGFNNDLEGHKGAAAAAKSEYADAKSEWTAAIHARDQEQSLGGVHPETAERLVLAQARKDKALREMKVSQTAPTGRGGGGPSAQGSSPAPLPVAPAAADFEQADLDQAAQEFPGGEDDQLITRARQIHAQRAGRNPR